MVKYEKKITSDKIHVPKSIRDAFGNDAEVYVQPNANVFVVYPKDTSVSKVRKGLKIIDSELEEEEDEG